MIRSTYLEMKCEFLGLLRMPRYSVMTVAFPVLFYVFFGVVMHQGDLGGVTASTYVLTVMSVFGVMFASLMGLGAGIASERGLGWLEVKRASPMPGVGWFTAKLSTAMLFSALVSGVLFAIGATFGGVRMGLNEWLLLWSAMALGSIPFATLGFVLGYLASSNSAPALVNLVAMPMALFSGLWVPIQFLPKFAQDLAPALPPYHLARIAQSIVGMSGSGPALPHVLALAQFTALFPARVGWYGAGKKAECMADGATVKTRKFALLPPDGGQGWLPYMWLVYLFNFVLPVVLGHATAREWWLTAGAVAVFLPLYFRGYWEQGWRQFALAAVMCALGLSLARWNPGSAVFIVYAVAAVIHDEDQRAAWRNVAILLAITGLAAWLFDLGRWFWMPAIGFSLFVAAFIAESRKRHRLNRRLGLAEDEIGRLARIAERERIARDLHDLLGHTLSLIVLKSELASKPAESDPVRTAREIRDVERISREALSEVRAAVAGYRSSGLAAELAHAREALHGAGIEFDSHAEPVAVSPSQESVLAMAIRGAVTNVLRHAGARRCRLTLRQRLESWELEISDDGKGGLAPDGFGITGMRERVEALGGTLERDGSAGMRLILRLPAAGPTNAL